MYAVMGATGHVGSAVTEYLLKRGRSVLAIAHRREHAEKLRSAGAEIAEVNVHDVRALRSAFNRCRRAFLLNPPAAVSTDTDVEERETVRCILEALDGSGLEYVVAESAYGAQPGERCGDLSVLYELEQGLQKQSIPATIQRAAYYMSNWDHLLEPVLNNKTLPTLFPADLALPMVAPEDLGHTAGRLLMEDPPRKQITYVEGPEPYSSNDVARAFSKALGFEVVLSVVPENRWESTFKQLGFSDAAATSYAKMTKVSIEGGFEMQDHPLRGSITLESYISRLAATHSSRQATS